MEMKLANKESKSILAKLLASENLTVEHGKFSTASFDVKNRVLRLPIWKEMSGSLYDLLVLHEVGHALFTPEEGLHDVNKKKYGKGFKSFLNVVEDARIERKIKIKYPGGRRSFIEGYSDLMDRDFFGLKKEETYNSESEKLNLIDKINLHYKVGDHMNLTFSDEENVFVDRIDKAQTWKDVVKICEDLYEYAKENESETDMSDHDWENDFCEADDGANEDWDDNYDPSDYEDDVNDENDFRDDSKEKRGEGEDTEKDDCDAPVDSCEDGESGEDGEDGKEKEGSGKSDSEGEKTDEEATGGKTGGLGQLTNEIQADTVLEWEQRKEDLNDDSGRDYWYANIPESNLDSIINYKDCLKDLKEWYVDGGIKSVSRDSESDYHNAYIEAAYKYATKIEKDSMRTVNYLLKEFEMKKSADSYQRASVAKTGVLDMLKMHSYKYNEDVFKRIAITPGDKNHGLVMFLDWSASMAIQHHDCFKQLLQIVWFCRRAGIKFEVYAFTDSGWSILGEKDNHQKRGSEEPKNSPTWKFKRHDLNLGNHLLFNIFSDRMSKQDMKKMVHYLTMVTFSISRRYSSNRYYDDFIPNEITEYLPEEHQNHARYEDYIPLPDAWHLGGTPLNGAIVNAMNFIPKYRSKNNIQKLNVVFITDGASNDSSNRRVDDEGKTEWPSGNSKVVYSDPVTKKSYNRVEYRRQNYATTSLLLNALKDRVKCNVVGFFLAQSRGSRVSNHDLYHVFPNQDIKALRKILKKDKVLVSDSQGYDEYYFVAGGSNLRIDDGELAIDDSMTRGKMAKGFTNYMKGKVVNRILLNKFVEQIA